MGNKVTFDYSKASTFVAKHEVDYMSKLAMDAKELLLSRKGAGNDFLGWIDFPDCCNYRRWIHRIIEPETQKSKA